MELANFLKFKEANQRIISIDFGSSSIKLAHLESRGNKFALLAYVLKELNCQEKSSQELSEALKEILKDNSINTKAAILSITDPEQIFIKKLILPQMPKNELLNAIKWQLKGEFSFSPEESVADVQIIREFSDSEGAKKIELFCIFAKRELINKYLSAATEAGLIPFKISNSVFNYYGTLSSLTNNPKICAILDIGDAHSNILIYQDNKLKFVRSLNFSTSKLSVSLVGSLATDKGRVEINSEKAGQLIRQYGIILDESVQLQDDLKASQIIPLMRPLLEILAKELERSFDFFKSESALDYPEILYLTAGGANLKNLDKYLEAQLKIKIEKLPLPASLDIKNIKTDEFSADAHQLSGAVGAAVSTGGINLIPPEIKSQKTELIQQSSLRITAIAVAAAFIFSWFVVSFQINDYKKRLKIAKLHLESVEEIKNLKQQVDLRENYINKILEGKVPAIGLLKLVGSIIPVSIVLNEFNFDQSSHSMRLSGVVMASKESAEKVLTDFMKNLEDSKFINDARLVSSKEDQGINTFEIQCLLVK